MIDNPIGIDAPIQDMQQLFIDNLWTSISDNKKEFNHRVFKNERKGNIIPEVLIDGTNDYKEVKFDDRLSVLSWFDVSETTSNVDGMQIQQDVGVFFAVNLTDIYPSLSHRAVEEVHRDVKSVLLERSTSWPITSIATNTEAYGDYNTDNLKSFNMQPWHVFRFNCNVSYILNCK